MQCLGHWSGVNNGPDNSLKRVLTSPKADDFDLPDRANRPGRISAQEDVHVSVTARTGLLAPVISSRHTSWTPTGKLRS